MKKFSIIAAACSFAVLNMLSCSKEGQNTENPGQEPVVTPEKELVYLSAGIETKVFSDGNTLKWNGAKEDLAVFALYNDAVEKYKFSKEAGTASTSATFSGEVTKGATLNYAAYPYTDDCMYEAAVLSMKLNETHSCDAANSIPHFTPLYGIVGQNNSITMYSPCAFLKVDLPKTTDQTVVACYESIQVNAAGCCGEFTVDFSGGNAVVSRGDANTISVTPRKNSSGYVYVPVLPGEYSHVDIVLVYNDGHSQFVKTSTKTQTFQSGTVYDVKAFSGPYVESVTTQSASVSGTNLQMTASAVCWKYSGVTNNDYSFKFYYRESGDGDFSEVAASSVTGDDTSVSFTANVEGVDESKSYEVYASVTGAGVAVDGQTITTATKESVVKEFSFLTAPTNFQYSTLSKGKNDGYKMIVDASGNPVFPTFKPSNNTADFYCKIWDAANGVYGETQHVTGATPSGQTGISIFNGDYSITINSTAKYYTVSSSLLCVVNATAIKMNCPTGYKISAVGIKIAKGKACRWGIGAESYYSQGDPEVLPFTDVANAEADVDVTFNIADKTVVNKPYYFISGQNNNRLGVLTITYEKVN